MNTSFKPQMFFGFRSVRKKTSSHETQIYEAVRNQDQLPVILKTSNVEIPTSHQITRLRNEFNLLSQLKHPGIVKVYDMTWDQQRPLVVMEKVNGCSLETYLEKNNVLEIKAFLAIAIQIAETLAYIHEQGVIHKDIKPSNLMIDEKSDKVKFIDFGVAVRLSREQNSYKTSVSIEGSLAFLSPELTGRMNREIDFRTDFYSLGITLFKLLTGKLPFDAKNRGEMIYAHLAVNPPLASTFRPGVPRSLDLIIAKLMSKPVEDRYKSALGLKADLEECLKYLNGEASGEFEIGKSDYFTQFLLPQGLYGRNLEFETLLKSYHLALEGKSEVVFVSGVSGMGKTSLIEELEKHLLARKGLFISGKQEEYKSDVPYAALIQGLQRFVHSLLTKSEGELIAWKAVFVNALGTDLQLIIEMLPDLIKIIGSYPPAAILDSPSKEQERFKQTFKKFIIAILEQIKPLVIFLDDLQWIDLPSLGLIEQLLSDDNVNSLLILGCYRSNDVTAGHPLTLFRKKMAHLGVQIKELKLSPLSQEHIQEMLGFTLNRDSKETASLAESISLRTAGNPFYVKQLLLFLYSEKIIDFNSDRKQWVWDLVKMNSIPASENVAELFVFKLNRLSEPCKEILQFAAVFGNPFSSRALSELSSIPREELLQRLSPAIEEGLLSSGEYREDNRGESDIYYYFLHDKILNVIYETMEEADLVQYHYKIARYLMDRTGYGFAQQELFDIAFHLNKALPLIVKAEDRLKASQINLKAALKSNGWAAYDSALHYAKSGIKLLATNVWEKNPRLAIGLYMNGLESAIANNELEESEKFTNILFTHVKDAKTRTQIYLYNINIAFLNFQFEKVESLSAAALQELNYSLPKRDVGIASLLKEYFKIQILLRGKSINDVASMPMIEDERTKLIIVLLVTSGPAFIDTDPIYSIILILKSFNLCLQKGTIEELPILFANYAVITGAVFNDFEKGYAWAHEANQIVDSSFDKRFACQTKLLFAIFCAQTKHHLSHCVRLIQESIYYGKVTGDTFFLKISMYYYPLFKMECAYSLQEALEIFKTQIRYFESFSIYQTIATLKTLQEIIQLLDANGVIPKAETIRNLVNLPYYTDYAKFESGHLYVRAASLKIAYHFAFNEAALAITQGFNQNNPIHFSSPAHQKYHFYKCLSLLRSYERLSYFQKVKALRDIRKSRKIIRKSGLATPQNCRHLSDLVEAEFIKNIDIEKDPSIFYENAITNARQNNYLFEEALSLELYGTYLLSRKRSLGRYFIRLSIILYGRYGAFAIVNYIRAKFKKVLLEDKRSGEEWEEVVVAPVLRLSGELSNLFQLKQIAAKFQKWIERTVFPINQWLFVFKENREMIFPSLHQEFVWSEQQLEQSLKTKEALSFDLNENEEVLLFPIVVHQEVIGEIILHQNKNVPMSGMLLRELLKVLTPSLVHALQKSLSISEVQEQSRNMLKSNETLIAQSSLLEIEAIQKTGELDTVYTALEKVNHQIWILEASRKEQQKLVFLAQIAHRVGLRLRGPISKILLAVKKLMALTQLPVTPQLSKKIEAYSKLILRQSNVLDRISTVLVKQASFGEGRTELLSLKRIFFEQNERIVAELKPKPRIEIDFIEDGVGTKAKVNKQEMGHIFYVLLKNSYEAILAKYKITPQISPKIHVHMHISLDQILFILKDNGAGRNDLSELIVPFYTTKRRGLGLNLFGCKEMIETLYLGKVNIHSGEEGTEVKVTIPVT